MLLNSFFKIRSKTNVKELVFLAEKDVDAVWEWHVHGLKLGRDE